MQRGTLFSSTELYLSEFARCARNGKDELTLEELAFANGSIIHSFLNEFVNVIVITEEEYHSYSKVKTIPIVSVNWVFDSIQNATLLPYVYSYFNIKFYRIGILQSQSSLFIFRMLFLHCFQLCGVLFRTF